MSDTEWMREALRELTAAVEGEAKAKLTADTALENYSDPSRESDAYMNAMVRVCEAMKQAKAALAVPEQAPETQRGIVFNLGPLLDEWDALPNDVRHDEELEGVRRWMQNVSEAAEEGRLYAAPAALPDGKDAERFRFWFSPAAKAVDMNGYLQGIRERWTTEKWRAFTDAAIQAQTEGERAPSPASESKE